MREIKFRGKCVPDSKYAGEWVTGGYVASDADCKKQDEGLIVEYLGGNTTITYHVDPSTVGQFTGLTDKNGKEIYEGDVLSVCVFDCFDNDTQYDVRVGWQDCKFVGTDVEDDYNEWDLGWLRNQDDEMEIIGNIYEEASDKEIREG